MIDDGTAEFLRRAGATSEPDAEWAWRDAAQLLEYANTPRRYIVGADVLGHETWRGDRT